MARVQKKAARGASKSRPASGGKTTGASTHRQTAASGEPPWEEIQRAAELAEQAVSAAAHGSTKIDEQQLHPAERAVHLAVHGSPQPEVNE